MSKINDRNLIRMNLGEKKKKRGTLRKSNNAKFYLKTIIFGWAIQ